MDLSSFSEGVLLVIFFRLGYRGVCFCIREIGRFIWGLVGFLLVKDFLYFGVVSGIID